MLNKLKNTVSNMIDTEKQGTQSTSQKKIDVSILSIEQIKLYKKILDKFKENIQTIDQIGQNNKEQILQFIKLRAKEKQVSGAQRKKSGNQDQDQDEKFTFQEDMNQIKDSLSDMEGQIKQIITFQQQIMAKISQLQQSPQTSTTASTQKAPQQLISKYEAQISALKKSEQNNKDILNTLSQQSQLYTKQVRDLQQKCQKMQKQINQKNQLINNLKEEKIVLLEMRNSSSAGQIPEFQALKGKLTQFQKRLNIQRSKVQTKEKEIQSLKKKMEEQHISLEKIADQLKEKELKSKRIIDKYERSKTEIRKFREEKTEFIKQLNMQVAKLSQQLSQQKKKSEKYHEQIAKLREEIDNLKSEVSKNQNRKIQLQSSQSQLVDVRKQLHEKNLFTEDQASQIKKLKQQNDQLHQKRKQLLQALQKPINHQIRTLQKILKALDKLYKEYITTVFQDGNIVGFEARITYIISNVQEIKEDLLL